MSEERLWTWEDIVHLPEQEMPEIIDGKPYFRAAPRLKHSSPQVRFYRGFSGGGADALDTGWWILADLDVRLGPNRLVRPDLCGYRKERLPELVDDWPLDLRPDWVCEILSPSNARYDRSTKGTIYADAGIPWYWLIDTQERMVEVWELLGGRWSVFGCFGEEDKLVQPPFDGLEFEVGLLFGGRAAPATP